MSGYFCDVHLPINTIILILNLKVMNLKRGILSIIMLFASMSVVFAEFLVVEECGGNITYYDLGTKPVITSKNSLFQVKSNEVSLELPLAEVAKFYFKAESTSLNFVSSNVFIAASKERVYIKNGVPGSLVEFYSMNGTQLGRFVIESDGNFEISLLEYASGVYVVKTDFKTIKIIK